MAAIVKPMKRYSFSYDNPGNLISVFIKDAKHFKNQFFPEKKQVNEYQPIDLDNTANFEQELEDICVDLNQAKTAEVEASKDEIKVFFYIMATLVKICKKVT